jgi:uncharacterized protein YecE (DUF72 family)
MLRRNNNYTSTKGSAIAKQEVIAYTNLIRALAQKNIYLGTTSAIWKDAERKFAASILPIAEMECTGINLPSDSTILSITDRYRGYIAWHVRVEDMYEQVFASDEWKQFMHALMHQSVERQMLILSLDDSIAYTPETLDILESFRDEVRSLICLLETSDNSWKTPNVQRVLKSLKWSHVFLDAPPLYGIIKDVEYHVASIAYLRVLGRNSYTWFEPEAEERFAYHYTKEELQELATRIRQLRNVHDQVFVIFCNRPGAFENVIELAHLLI